MMKPLFLLIAVVLLVGCVPEYQPPAEEIKEPSVPREEIVLKERVIPYPYTKVWQQRGNQTILWGYDQGGHLILLNSSDRTVVVTYADDAILEIDDGVKPMKFFYDNKKKLLSAEQGILRWIFSHSSRGTLLSMDNSEKLTFTHDSKGRLSSVKRDGGVSTEFEYDDQNRTKAMFKNQIMTDLVYDDRGRLKLMNRQDDHLVLAYWRHDLLSSLSGTMYGLKETVNYGLTEITLVSDTEQNTFTSAYADQDKERVHAFNTFLFCTRFRKLPVLFDGQSWVLYHEYLKGNITDYLFTGFLCEYLP